MIQAFIIDDEPLSVTRLAVLLRRFDDVQIVGTATEPIDAIDKIRQHVPDVLFVDIEMPGMDGFDVIQSVARLGGPVPLIVFVTAFPKFAADAFDSGVIDFVTKPVRFDRLSACIGRVREALESRIARDRLKELLEQLEQLRSQRMGEDRGEHRYLWVQRRGEALRVDLDRLDRVSAEGEYVRLFVGSRDYLHRGSVTALAAMLDPTRYLRVHRSHIVRIDAVVSVRRRATGSYSLILDSDVVLPVGRRYRHVIRTFSRAATEQRGAA
jgi:DNA-binding LytR/AlgR family response regulator